MVEPDTIIDGRYRVISRIGSGGMADVYLAEDRLLGRQVAVKILHPRFAEDHEFVERFRREASSAAGLSHPNVVAVFDRGEWNGTYYIAMEYLPGRSLKRIVQEHGALDPASAIDITIQVLQAARFAHRRGIIHRDLKPHNVILDEEGRAKVTDFGIARAGASDMTLTGSIMGTAQYLSPEQAQGHQVSAASDLYAIGIILYELLTGQIPFDGETAVSIALKQVSAVPPAPSSLNSGVPASLDAVVLRALAKSPTERFADAQQFITALEAAREGLRANSTTVIAQQPTESGQPHNNGLVLAPEQQPDGRSRSTLWIALVGVAVLALLAAAFLLFGNSTRVTIPNVAGLARSQAAARLVKVGLKPAYSYATSPTVATGIVINTSPAAGRRVPSGSRVTLVVSAGPGSLAIPEVAGLTRQDAVQTLERRGFKPKVRSKSSSTVKEGVVIATNPPAGTDVQIGSMVTVLVSDGPALIKVPEVLGDTEAQAKSALSAANLKLGTVSTETSDQTPGTVISQSPSAGQQVSAGATVDLVLAEATPTIVVPDVGGSREERAIGELLGAGFKTKTVTRAVSETSQNGVVIAQNPRAGSRARRGTTVTITVGSYAGPTETTTTTESQTTPAPATPSPAPNGG